MVSCSEYEIMDKHVSFPKARSKKIPFVKLHNLYIALSLSDNSLLRVNSKSGFGSCLYLHNNFKSISATGSAHYVYVFFVAPDSAEANKNNPSPSHPLYPNLPTSTPAPYSHQHPSPYPATRTPPTVPYAIPTATV